MIEAISVHADRTAITAAAHDAVVSDIVVIGAGMAGATAALLFAPVRPRPEA